jgi:trimeric autotransporter adhesin
LAVTGSFNPIAGTQIVGVARWNGSNWAQLGNNVGGGPLALLPNGDLVDVYCHLYGPGQPFLYGPGRWDGQSWTSLNMQIGPDTLSRLRYWAACGLPNGDIIIGGSYFSVNGQSMPNIARWNGTAWVPMAGGLPGQGVYALLTLSDGSVIAGGDFSVQVGSQQATSVARWNGQQWTALGTGLLGEVRRLLQLSDGDVVATGNLSIPGIPGSRGLARWDGEHWRPYGAGLWGLNGNWQGYALAQHQDGSLLVAGNFHSIDNHPSFYFARYHEEATPCSADLDDGSNTNTRDCAVTVDDLLFFLTAFEAGAVTVDLDNGTSTGTPDGAVTVDDLLFFLVRFEAGC